MADPKPVIPVPNKPVFIWPTPSHKDLLFWVWRDGALPKYANGQWKKGDKFENGVEYPNHRLVYVTPQDEQKWSKWYYMAERADQDLYNWEHTQADIGGTKFDAVQRTYVTLREDFDPEVPAMGTVMPDEPEETFDTGYVLAQRKQMRGDPEFDSIFVAEQRVYVRKVTLTDYKPEPETGIADYEQTTLYYRGEKIGGTAVEALFADTGNALGYWSSDANGYGREGKQLSDNWFAVTLRSVVTLDTDYGGESSRLYDDRFLCPKGRTTETVFSSDNPPGPVVLPTAGLGTAVAVSKRGRIYRRKTTTQIGIPKPIKGTTLEPRTGETFVETHEEVPITEVAASEVDANGQVILYEPKDACFSVKTTRKVRSTKVKTWTDIMNFEWPPVLTHISFSIWPKKSGSSAVIPKVRYKRGFHGPQAAVIRQWWQKTEPTVVVPIQMIPEGVDYGCPLYQINIPPCLHGPIQFSCTTGANDPTWANATETYTVIATNFTDWPNQIQWVESKPDDGGYLVTETTLNKPS